MLLVVAAVVYAYEKTPIPTDVSEAALQQSSTVYFSNGKTGWARSPPTASTGRC